MFPATMSLPPAWFYRETQPRIAGYVGPDAAALWVSSRFWYVVAWTLAGPLGLGCTFLAETGSPAALWIAAGAAWAAAVPFGWQSLAKASAARKAASLFLTQNRGYRMEVQLPVTPWAFQWTRVVERADEEHGAHVELARTAGVHAAIDQLVERRRAERRLWWVALALFGLLAGIVIGGLVAVAIGQTKSLGVFILFVSAIAGACALPYLLYGRHERALDKYRVELTEELGQGMVDMQPVPVR